MRVMGLAGRCGAAMGLLGVGLTACQMVAGIEDIELTSGSSAAGTSSGAGTGGKSGSSSSTSSSSTAASTSSSGAGGSMSLHYKAKVADCVYVNAPNPDTCESQTGPAQMRIDTFDGTINSPVYVFLRFDLDNAFAKNKVVGVTLHLSTSNDFYAPSDKSGEIWEVAAFDRPNLSSNPLPMDVGASAISPDLGPVAGSTMYSWPLPTTLVAPNTHVHLKLKPNSTDPARYWNAKNMTAPPDLVIDVQ